MPSWNFHTFNVLKKKKKEKGEKRDQAVNSGQTLVIEASNEEHKTAFSGL